MKFSCSLIIFLFVCLSSRGIGQELSVEEKKVIQVLLDSSDYYFLRDPEKSFQFAARILTQVPEEGNESFHIEAILNSANTKKIQSRKEEALSYVRQAIHLSNRTGRQDWLVRSYYMQGSIFGQDDQHDSSLIAFQKVIDYNVAELSPYYISGAYTAVGRIYNNIGNEIKAEEYLLKGYQLSSSDEYSKIFALSSIIAFYVGNDNLKYLPYLDTLEKSDFYKKASPNSFIVHFETFLLLDEATDAEKEKTLREVYNYSLDHSSLVNQVGYGRRLYEHLHKMERYEEAEDLLLELRQKAKESNNGFYLSDMTGALYENSKAKKDLTGALKYLEQYSELRDSLLSEENTTRISELNIRFETAQKDNEIEQQKIRLDQERRNRNFFIALALLLTALAITVFIYFRNRARTTQRIAEQDKVIHKQETEKLQKEKELSQLTATLESQERERNRIARDLHDSLGSMMSGISSQIEYLRSQPAIEQAGHPHLGQLREMVNEATSEIRRTSYELMPAKLLRQGLEPAIRDQCLNLLVRNGIEPSLEINADLGILNPEQQLTLYRIVQELLNNIVKHAEAKQVLIQFTRIDDEISLVVEDDGKGFDVASGKLDGGLGLGSLGSRVNLLNGFLDIASIPGEGTTITVNFRT